MTLGRRLLRLENLWGKSLAEVRAVVVDGGRPVWVLIGRRWQKVETAAGPAPLPPGAKVYAGIDPDQV